MVMMLSSNYIEILENKVFGLWDDGISEKNLLVALNSEIRDKSLHAKPRYMNWNGISNENFTSFLHEAGNDGNVESRAARPHSCVYKAK